MNIKRVSTLMIVLVIITTFAGCGYTTKVTLPSGIQTVYVPNFTNSIPQSKQYTYESGLEIDVTNGVIDRLLFEGVLKVVKEESADAVLLGEIIAYEQEVVRYTSSEGVSQYRLFIVTKLTLQRRGTKEIIWQENNFSGDTEYYIEGGNAVTERAAANQAIEDLAKKIVDRIVQNW
ncbi:MAG: hypothetical protein KKH94_03110 [Candidatus Omnitrophica bacterium]|nr:hypothetical protein [Candidatus Omnitrophota bacterium]